MLKDITIGQYFPGTTAIHRMDPRTKLLDVVLYIVALFCCKGVLGYLSVLIFLVAAVRISKIPFKTIMKGVNPLIVIIAFTAILNMFYTPGNELVRIWKLKITDAGLRNAVTMMVRIVMLVAGTFLLTYTTSPITLTDGLERLLNPLKKVKVPVHELAMMMSIALRFIPTLIEETDKIMSAQKARGADFETGNLIDKAKALIPVLVPLFVSAFRRADELATAMECRCYVGGEGRTRLSPLKWQRLDTLGLGAGIVMLAAVIVFRIFGL